MMLDLTATFVSPVAGCRSGRAECATIAVRRTVINHGATGARQSLPKRPEICRDRPANALPRSLRPDPPDATIPKGLHNEPPILRGRWRRGCGSGWERETGRAKATGEVARDRPTETCWEARVAEARGEKGLEGRAVESTTGPPMLQDPD